MIRVINVRSYEPQPGEKYVYSARGSALGNPFSWLEGTKADFTCADREESLQLYKAWLDEQIRLRTPAVVNELNRLYKLAQQQPLALGCYCAPKPATWTTYARFSTLNLTLRSHDKARATIFYQVVRERA